MPQNLKPRPNTLRKAHCKAVSSLEFALVLPLVVLLCMSLTQLILFFQSASVLELAAFSAARSYQIYGDRTLQSIAYSKDEGDPYTNSSQSIAEARAERIVFESLMWESQKVKLRSANFLSYNRAYSDGSQSYNNQLHSFDESEGSVGLNFITQSQDNCIGGEGVQVYYCMPMVFPFTNLLFKTAMKDYPCKGKSFGKTYQGIAIVRKACIPKAPEES